MHDQTQEQEISFLLIIFIHKNHLRKENIGQLNFKKPFGFHSFRETFTVACFYTMSIHKNPFKKQKYGTESV